MSDIFDEYDEDLRDYTRDEDYEFLEPSVGEVLKVIIWTTFATIVVLCALINLI
jgi:preprotein translocase subunit SecF